MAGCIFLDRDGTINELAPPHHHITTRQTFRFLPGTLDALAFLNKNSGRKIAIVTNQSCIERGTATPGQIKAMHAWMKSTIATAGGRVDGIYVCPHTPEQLCLCRKPQPGLLFRAEAALGIDLSRSCLVGDDPTDIQAAWAAGIPECYVVLTGRPLHGFPPTTDARTYAIYGSLHDAARAIVAQERTSHA